MEHRLSDIGINRLRAHGSITQRNHGIWYEYLGRGFVDGQCYCSELCHVRHHAMMMIILMMVETAMLARFNWVSFSWMAAMESGSCGC